MPDFRNKKDSIIYQIQNGISEINERYRKGPSLYFYRRTFEVRRENPNLDSFFQKDYHFELLYATLVSWDMNSRRAKMKDFDDLRANILSCRETLEVLNDFTNQGKYLFNQVAKPLKKAYESLSIMATYKKLVSNSKLLHFLFPDMLMPMDGRNTLTFFYNRDTNESINKYLEIIELSFEIMDCPLDWNVYLDSRWNTTKAKIIDNAIIMIEQEKRKRLSLGK